MPPHSAVPANNGGLCKLPVGYRPTSGHFKKSKGFPEAMPRAPPSAAEDGPIADRQLLIKPSKKTDIPLVRSVQI